MRIGVLALQGAFIEHQKIISDLGHTAVEVRLPEDLNSIDGLIIPGGESTVIGKLARDFKLLDPIREFSKAKPIWGTCAGLILLANKISGQSENWLAIIDAEVSRNAFGRQIDSFTEDLDFNGIENQSNKFNAVFIRAPKIANTGKNVQVLATLQDGSPVAIKQGKILGTCFHPELTMDSRIHKYFIELCAK